jgi:Holliday junction resolvasome RuvABC DNA-binding subunit
MPSRTATFSEYCWVLRVSDRRSRWRCWQPWNTTTVAPGVGKRGAQKIILELAPKLAGREAQISGSDSAVTVRQALESLGYSTEEINPVVSDIDPTEPLELQIRSALQALGRR